MALRSPALFMGNPAVQHTAQNDRLAKAGLLRPETGQTASSRPLSAASGVLIGPAGTMGEVAVLSNTQFTVNPARWLIMASASALGGCYEVTNDAVTTLGITAQDATQTRRSYWGVWVLDSFVAGSGDDLPHWGLIDGPLAASNPQLPSAGSLPTNFLALGEFLIPPIGGAVTYTPYDVRTGLRGGILPVTATDTRLPAYDGQVRFHPTLGLQVGRAGVWGPPLQGVGKRVVKNGTATLGAGAWVQLGWDVVDPVLDPGTPGMWSGGGPITAPVKGIYAVSCGIQNVTNLQIRSNANGVSTGGSQITATTGNPTAAYIAASASGFLLNANDYVQAFGYNTTSQAAGTASGYTAFFSLALIAALP